MVENAKICLDCGSLEWQSEQTSTVTQYGWEIYSPNEEGTYRSELNISDNDESPYWDDTGNEECVECGNGNLEDLDWMNLEQFKVLLALSPDLRVEALELIRENKPVDPKTGKELKKFARKSKRGKYIGEKVGQIW
jgi:hypothetical protein